MKSAFVFLGFFIFLTGSALGGWVFHVYSKAAPAFTLAPIGSHRDFSEAEKREIVKNCYTLSRLAHFVSASHLEALTLGSAAMINYELEARSSAAAEKAEKDFQRVLALTKDDLEAALDAKSAYSRFMCARDGGERAAQYLESVLSESRSPASNHYSLSNLERMIRAYRNPKFHC
jgi:hypothetical protein